MTSTAETISQHVKPVSNTMVITVLRFLHSDCSVFVHGIDERIFLKSTDSVSTTRILHANHEMSYRTTGRSLRDYKSENHRLFEKFL